MADWILVPCLVRLRAEFNSVAPRRARDSDGTIGDRAHQNRSSDHNPDETGTVPVRDADRINEVHALDIDKDLRTPGLDMEKVVQFLVGRCRAGTERRLLYIIWNRRIWHRRPAAPGRRAGRREGQRRRPMSGRRGRRPCRPPGTPGRSG
jgi:hypothetical protein